MAIPAKTSPPRASATPYPHPGPSQPFSDIGHSKRTFTPRRTFPVFTKWPLRGLAFGRFLRIFFPFMPAAPSSVRALRSSLYAGERFAKINAAVSSAEPNPHTMLQIMVDPKHTFQEWIGFGGAFTESSAHLFAGMTPENQEKVLTAYFDPVEGNAYTLCRTHINSCDFSFGNWANADQDGDFELKSFTIDRDKKQIIPMIKRALAKARGKIQLFASPWSPPSWMKTNGSMLNGGKLKPECRDAWASYYCRYLSAFEAEGLPMWGLTVQNEPAAVQRWESCVYTAEEERDFVRDHLGPALAKSGHGDKKLIVWDHNRDMLIERAAVIFNDPKAAAYIWGIGFHWYMSDSFHHVRAVKEAFPDKHLVFTEGCQEGGPHPLSWPVGERYGRSIINDLNNGTEFWCDWNLILDETGGPNHVGNLCSAPILADNAKKELIFNPSFYALGHFSKFIRPGAKRVTVGSSLDNVLATAFLNTDGALAVVVMNQSEGDHSAVIRFGDRHVEIDSPRRSFVSIEVAL
jgi:glucosylceramidase